MNRGHEAFDPPKLVGYGVVAILVGVIAVQYVLALGPSSERDLSAPCRAMLPTTASPALGRLPVAAPDFAVVDREGNERKLTDYRGKVVFLNFWQTACPPCIEEMPSMDRLQRALGGKDLVMLALASETDFKPIDKFLRGRPTAMTILLDPPRGDSAVGDVSKRYGTLKWPETYLIDRRGQVRYYYINKRDWMSPRAHQCIRTLIEE